MTRQIQDVETYTTIEYGTLFEQRGPTVDGMPWLCATVNVDVTLQPRTHAIDVTLGVGD